MFQTYKHKKQILFAISNKPLSSRYVIPYSMSLAHQKDIQITFKNREIKINAQIASLWIALVTDAGIYFHYLNPHINETRFTLQNEQPIMILLGISAENVVYYPIATNNL